MLCLIVNLRHSREDRNPLFNQVMDPRVKHEDDENGQAK